MLMIRMSLLNKHVNTVSMYICEIFRHMSLAAKLGSLVH